MSRLVLYFLGTPRLELDGEAITLSHHKALALLAYLAVTRQPHTRQALAALLWPEYKPDQARSELRRMLWVLNKRLGQGWLEVDRETVRLPDRPELWLDANRFRELLAGARQHHRPAAEGCPGGVEALAEAVNLARGDFLAGFTIADSPDFDTWQSFETESLRRELAGALEQLVELLARDEEAPVEQAITYARRWVAMDPLHEPAQRWLMELYSWSGQAAVALRQYQSCAQILREELGIDPSAETTALYEAIKEDRLSPPSTKIEQKQVATSLGPLPPVPSRPSHNLPVQATPFIGRESALSGLQQRLADPEVRLVTIIGPGGIGKTRLALALAQRQLQLESAFKDGIYFISLAPISSAEAIVQTMAEGMGFPLVRAEEPAIQLLTYLRYKQMLFVLDNFEHVLAGVEWVSQLLQKAGGVKVVVTSRERLKLIQENLWPVGGLSYAGMRGVEEALSYEAVQLFMQRARQVRPDFVLRAEELGYLVGILQGVWGMPLAIELAAGWLNMLSIAEIAAELSQGLDLLESELRDIPGRHRSMRLVFERSWERLEGEEQELMKRLSIFRGGFTREAAGEVAGATLRLLAGLVNKSLLSSQPESGRYELHELIRQYAATHLQAEKQEEQAAYERHSRYYLSLLQSHEPALFSHRQKEAFSKLNADIDNIRTALEVAITNGQIDVLRSVAWPLYYFYELHQYFQEAEGFFRRGAEMVRVRLSELEPDSAIEERARLEGALGDMLNYQAFFTHRQGRNREAFTLYQASIALLRPLHETQALAFALVHYGVVYWATGDFEEASSNLYEGLILSRALEQIYLQSLTLGLLGGVTHDKGNYTEAYRWLSESMALCRMMGDPYLILFIGIYFSRTAQALDRLTEAQNVLREGLQLAKEAGNRWGIGLALERMAVIAQATGDNVEARCLIEESIALHREVGDRWSLSWALNALSRLALTQLDIAEAEGCAVEALRIAVEAEYNMSVLDTLAILAAVRAQQGLSTAALEMALHIQHHPASTQEAKDRAEKLRAGLETQLTPQQLEMIETQLWAQSFDAFVKEILDTGIAS